MRFRLTGNYGTFVISRVVEAVDEEHAFHDAGIAADLRDAGWRFESMPDGEEWTIEEVG